MFSCCGGGKKKNTPTSSPLPSLPPNVLLKIASKATPKTHASMSRAATIPSFYTRRQMPIGLAVTKVGSPLVPPRRHPPLNRSSLRKIAVSARIPNPFGRYYDIRSKKLNRLNRVNPMAYRNKNWKYYTYDTRTGGHAVFFNTPKGDPFWINKRTGARIPFNASSRAATRLEFGPLQSIRSRLKERKKVHTWENYLTRRANAFQYARGKNQRSTKLASISRAVNKMLNENNTSNVNKVTNSDLLWWVKHTNWMDPRSYNIRNKKLVTSGGTTLNRKGIMNNIRVRAQFRN